MMGERKGLYDLCGVLILEGGAEKKVPLDASVEWSMIPWSHNCINLDHVLSPRLDVV